MPVLDVRGGVPKVIFVGTVGAGGAGPAFPFWFTAKHLRVRNFGGGSAQMFFTAADQIAGTPYVTIGVGDIWSEMYEGDVVWIWPSGGVPTTLEIVAFQRRG